MNYVHGRFLHTAYVNRLKPACGQAGRKFHDRGRGLRPPTGWSNGYANSLYLPLQTLLQPMSKPIGSTPLQQEVSHAQTLPYGVFSLPVIIGALGFFVDIYDLLLFNIVRIASFKELGLSLIHI